MYMKDIAKNKSVNLVSWNMGGSNRWTHCNLTKIRRRKISEFATKWAKRSSFCRENKYTYKNKIIEIIYTTLIINLEIIKIRDNKYHKWHL